MSCIALNTELEDKNNIRELGVFIDGKIQENHFLLQAYWCTRNLNGIVWKKGRLDHSELSNILPRAVNGELFAKGTKKYKILGNLAIY